MSVVASTPFNTTALAPDVVHGLRRCEAVIRKKLRSSIEDFLTIGNELLEAKILLGHGQFEAWVGATFQFSVRTARRYMSAAELAAKSAIVSELALPPTLIYQAATLPEARVAEVFAPRQDDDPPDLETTVKVRIACIRREERARKTAAAADARRTPEQRARKKASKEREQREWEQHRRDDDIRDKELRQQAQEAANLIAEWFGGALGELQDLVRDLRGAELITAILEASPPQPEHVETQEHVDRDAYEIAAAFMGARA